MIQPIIRITLTLLLLVTVLLIAGCKNDTPLALFQPEISNNPDNFQFQITAAQNVNTTVEYTWQNSGSRATVNQSSAITLGFATVTILDSHQVLRYTSSLSSNGTFQSDTGAAGAWKIRVILNNLSGALNFRVQKL